LTDPDFAFSFAWLTWETLAAEKDKKKKKKQTGNFDSQQQQPADRQTEKNVET
jgi:hypothetical protein